MPLPSIVPALAIKRAYCDLCRYAHKVCCCDRLQSGCPRCTPPTVADLAAIFRDLRDELAVPS